MEIKLTFWAKIDVTNRSSKTKHRNQILHETHLPSNLCHLYYVNHKILWSGGQSLKSKDFGEFLRPASMDKKESEKTFRVQKRLCGLVVVANYNLANTLNDISCGQSCQCKPWSGFDHVNF